MLGEVRVPRWLGASAADAETEIHGFADASESAYAAVVYLRTNGGDRGVGVSLVLARTRVASLKPVSLPRLELCAALMLTRLVEQVLRILPLAAAPVFLWSDSTVTLGWTTQPDRPPL